MSVKRIKVKLPDFPMALLSLALFTSLQFSDLMDVSPMMAFPLLTGCGISIIWLTNSVGFKDGK